MAPELAAYKFMRWLSLPPNGYQLRIRNEWAGDVLTHALIVAISSDYEVETPAMFEGYPVRRVRWGK